MEPAGAARARAGQEGAHDEPLHEVLLEGTTAAEASALARAFAGFGLGARAVGSAVEPTNPRPLVVVSARATLGDLPDDPDELPPDDTAGLPVMVVGARSDEVDETTWASQVAAVVSTRLLLAPEPDAASTEPGARVGRMPVSEAELLSAVGSYLRADAGVSGAVIALEAPVASPRLGAGALRPQDVARALVAEASAVAAASEVVAWGSGGTVLVFVPGRDHRSLTRRVDAIAGAFAQRADAGVGVWRHLTPAVGWTPLTAGRSAADVVRMARSAAAAAGQRLDLQPVRWTPRIDAPAAARSMSRAGEALTTVATIALTVLVGFAAPLVALRWLEEAQPLASAVVYWVLSAGIMATALLVAVESLLALVAPTLPGASGAATPTASAIIAAYLPNEADSIVATVRAFQAVDYPGLQVVLAYNTPRDLPVEEELRRIAALDPTLELMRVPGSRSKADNVNAALGRAEGEVVGVFDADHHPAPDAFARAARWLTAGYDVVQGRCAVRNGADSRVAGTVATEFDVIYGVSHPGRAVLHGFAIFGGSNGYWRSGALRSTRFRGDMLTEDIDASIRLVLRGGRVACDPGLVSTELAPTSLPRLWRQRMRWAQGWHQVSRRHAPTVTNAAAPTPRQRIGLFLMTRWREVAPWLPPLMLAVILAHWSRTGTLLYLAAVPAALTVLAGLAGLVQLVVAHRLRLPATSPTAGAYLRYAVVNALLYAPLKDLISRVAQVRNVLRLNEWVVTPRS